MACAYSDEEEYSEQKPQQVQGPKAGVWLLCSTRSKKGHVATAKQTSTDYVILEVVRGR